MPADATDRPGSEAPAPVEVPHTALAPDVLRRLVEEFVTRDGTDYGAVERTLEQKVAAVLRQLAAGEAAIEVDVERESVHVVERRPGRRR